MSEGELGKRNHLESAEGSSYLDFELLGFNCSLKYFVSSGGSAEKTSGDTAKKK